jgi:hypothetical protein
VHEREAGILQRLAEHLAQVRQVAGMRARHEAAARRQHEQHGIERSHFHAGEPAVALELHRGSGRRLALDETVDAVVEHGICDSHIAADGAELK